MEPAQQPLELRKVLLASCLFYKATFIKLLDFTLILFILAVSIASLYKTIATPHAQHTADWAYVLRLALLGFIIITNLAMCYQINAIIHVKEITLWQSMAVALKKISCLNMLLIEFMLIYLLAFLALPYTTLIPMVLLITLSFMFIPQTMIIDDLDIIPALKKAIYFILLSFKENLVIYLILIIFSMIVIYSVMNIITLFKLTVYSGGSFFYSLMMIALCVALMTFRNIAITIQFNNLKVLNGEKVG